MTRWPTCRNTCGNSRTIRRPVSSVRACTSGAGTSRRREDLDAAHRLAPDDPQVQNNLAWLLATCPVVEIRDGTRAVALARRAGEETGWQHPFCLGTLAAALAETGAFAEAAHWQWEALELYPEEEKAAGESRLALYRAGQPYRE
jgi:hypothetical protein